MGIENLRSIDAYAGYGTVAATPSATPSSQSSGVPSSDTLDENQKVAAASDQVQIRPEAAHGSDAGDKANTDESENDPIEATSEQIKKAVDEINKKAMNAEAVFGIYEKTNRITIKIVGKESKDAIKEVPAESSAALCSRCLPFPFQNPLQGCQPLLLRYLPTKYLSVHKCKD